MTAVPCSHGEGWQDGHLCCHFGEEWNSKPKVPPHTPSWLKMVESGGMMDGGNLISSLRSCRAEAFIIPAPTHPSFLWGKRALVVPRGKMGSESAWRRARAGNPEKSKHEA